MAAELPATLAQAIASQPIWLQAWVMALMGAHLLAIPFIAHRSAEGWRIRPEPIAILVSFLAAAAAMTWLYGQVGYVRLLGIAHLAFWAPVYFWILQRRQAIGTASLFGKYVLLYLLIAGISLLIDAVDLVRYLVG
jgi:hypothetical protein